MQKVFQAFLAVSQLLIGGMNLFSVFLGYLLISLAANLFLRTYALYDRSRFILLLLIAISAGGIAVAVVRHIIIFTSRVAFNLRITVVDSGAIHGCLNSQWLCQFVHK